MNANPKVNMECIACFGNNKALKSSWVIAIHDKPAGVENTSALIQKSTIAIVDIVRNSEALVKIADELNQLRNLNLTK